MKKLIFSLVIAIVSSVNVFGQIIHFNDNTEVFFNGGNGTDTLIYSLHQNNPNIILNHNLMITKFELNGVVYENCLKTNDIMSNITSTQYRYSNDSIYLRLKDNDKIRIFVFSGNNLSVGTQVEVSNLTLYPNPVQDVLNIRFDSYENVDVVVTDLNGRIVYNENVSGFTSVNLSNQPSGIYFVNVGSTTRKVVKQ